MDLWVFIATSTTAPHGTTGGRSRLTLVHKPVKHYRFRLMLTVSLSQELFTTSRLESLQGPQPKLIQGGSGGTNKIRCVQRLCRLESICRYYSAALRSTTSHVPKASQATAQFRIVIELLSLQLQSPPYDRLWAAAPQPIEGNCCCEYHP